jgi:hypothetical protein
LGTHVAAGLLPSPRVRIDFEGHAAADSSVNCAKTHRIENAGRALTSPQGTVLKWDKTLNPGSGACGLPCGGGYALLVIASSLRTLRSPIALQPLRRHGDGLPAITGPTLSGVLRPVSDPTC